MQKETLVAMLTDDAFRLLIPGTSFDRVCSECKKPVALAPTGQKWLKKNPALPIVCCQCLFALVRRDQPEKLTFVSAGSTKETLSEIRSARVILDMLNVEPEAQ